MLKEFTLIAAFAVLAVLMGCTGSRSPIHFTDPPQLTGDVRIQAGDVVEIKFFDTPELNDRQAVRPGGRITLHMVGDVVIDDLTPDQAAQAIAHAYRGILRDPRLVVIMRSQPDRKVFVSGEVRAPGTVAMPGTMTALEAVMAAGGFDPVTSEPARVIVIRHQDGKRYGAGIDLSLPLDGETTTPFYLKPKDIVFVPKSFIADVNQWIDQHINKIVPEFGYSFGVTTNNKGEKTTTHSLDLTGQ